MNKKADHKILGPEIVKLIIAVIGITLIFIIFGIFLGFLFGKSSMEKAIGTLEYIIEEVKKMQPGSSRIITVTTPKGWHIVCFEENVNINKNNYEKPSSMLGKRVLCICEKNKCDEKACREIDLIFKMKNETLFLKINIMDLNITHAGTHYEVELLKKYEN
ncbi:MAG: hypothetical protein NZ889_00280 [Candidatus Pacearchaeota archaeon]|nr:hypothetical protein [Candidatus Pacearchaeota archaeon]